MSTFRHAVVGLLVLSSAALAGQAAAASESVIYSFSGLSGTNPLWELVIDSQGQLYGTTIGSGNTHKYDIAFRLTPPAGGTGDWTETTLYAFTTGGHGRAMGALLPNGSGGFYGPDGQDGGSGKLECSTAKIPICGIMIELTPPTTGTIWKYTAIYNFPESTTAPSVIYNAAPIADSKGSLYDTSFDGGGAGGGAGTAFELIHPAPHKTKWTEATLYSFCSQVNCTDGRGAGSALVADSSGALYGTTTYGGNIACPSGGGGVDGCGVVFMLTPPAVPGGAWTETVIHAFAGAAAGGDGALPQYGLTIDGQGNLYGSTSYGGDTSCSLVASQGGCGTVFELSPPAIAGNPWTETVLYAFTTPDEPSSGVIRDASGNLYGETFVGGDASLGTVYELTPPGGGGSWTETVLNEFGHGTDGALPGGGLTFGLDGTTLYGTTNLGGSIGAGTAFQITQ